MPPEESVPERRDLPPLPLPPKVNSQKEYPVQAKRLFVEDNREDPPLPIIPRGEEAFADAATDDAPEFHHARPDEAVFRLSHLAGEEGADPVAGDEDRVGGLIPPRLRSFRHMQKSWGDIKHLLEEAAKVEENEEDEAIAESRKRLEAALKSGDTAAVTVEEKKLEDEKAVEGGGVAEAEGGEEGDEESGDEGAASEQGVHVPTRGEVSAASAQRIQDAVDRRISLDNSKF